MPTPDEARLQRMLAAIRRDPKKHNPRIWRCRTAMCAAGHTVTEEGLDNWVLPVPGPKASYKELSHFEAFAHALLLLPEEQALEGFELNDSPYMPVEHRARRILGLTQAQANDLFSASNSLEDLEHIVGKLIDGTWEDPGYDDEDYDYEEDYE